MGSWDQRSVPTSTYEDGKGAECELRSTSRPDGHSATPAPGQPGRSLHELQRLCPPPLWSSPPGQDSPHYSRSNVRRPRAQGHPGLYPGLPEAAGTTLLLQTPHVIHQLSKLSQLEYPQDGPDSGSPSGTCRQKDPGVPWSSQFKIRKYGHSLIGMHVLLTSYWACGFLGRQKPRSFPETRALSPAAMWTWHPSQSPQSGYPRASSPAPPREGPSVARPELTDHQDCPGSDNGRPGSPERHTALGNMDLDTLQVFQRELTCSICMNCFLDPVTIDCGHSFCRPCLSLCWEEGQTPRSCPECSGLSERPDFKTNIVLKRLASLARQVRADHNHSSEEQICVTHQEAKGLFCEADQTLLCGPCSERPEHAAHSHRPIHRVAEESREKLMKRMRTLWKLREEMKISLNQEANKTQSFENYVALRKAMITVQYQRIPLLLQEDEKLHLEALEQEAKEICQLLKESVFKMTQQGEILREMYRELTEMCHKPDMELLQVRKKGPSSERETLLDELL
ncbi:hypothetical protein R6Z07M_017136 [Ovis aries]